jgi:hypothetical protein
MANLRQTPLTCSGHTRPVVHLAFSDVTECGYFLISACKGELCSKARLLLHLISFTLASLTADEYRIFP